MERPTMGDLIARVRGLIADETAPTVFTDDRVEAALDDTRQVARYLPLRPEPTRQPDGVLAYFTFYSDLPDWEAGAQLIDGFWQDVTGQAVEADLQTGCWRFAEGRLPILYLNGRCYDRYAAAAALLEAWAARLMLEFDFASQNVRYVRSQQAQRLLAQAALYRARSGARRAEMGRSDIAARSSPTIELVLGPHN